MQIFVAYGYNERDKWIEEFVFPLIEAFGCEVATGKVMYGQELVSEVRETIQTCDALFGFLSGRKSLLMTGPKLGRVTARRANAVTHHEDCDALVENPPRFAPADLGNFQDSVDHSLMLLSSFGKACLYSTRQWDRMVSRSARSRHSSLRLFEADPF